MGSSRGLCLKPGHQSRLLCKSSVHQLLWGGTTWDKKVEPWVLSPSGHCGASRSGRWTVHPGGVQEHRVGPAQALAQGLHPSRLSSHESLAPSEIKTPLCI